MKKLTSRLSAVCSDCLPVLCGGVAAQAPDKAAKSKEAAARLIQPPRSPTNQSISTLPRRRN